MQHPRVMGVVGWSGSGKTTLLTLLIPLLTRRGLRVATLKHAHHEFDVDTPGKDSYEHRKAGAGEVIICSARRWVQMHELVDEPEPTLADLLRRTTPCDMILVEGFKSAAHLKLEVYRAATGKLPLYPHDARVIAVASDAPLQQAGPQFVDLNNIAAIADLVLLRAPTLQDTLTALASAP